MAWYDDLDHTTVAASIPRDLAERMDRVRGRFNRSRYIRNLIESAVENAESLAEAIDDMTDEVNDQSCDSSAA